METYYLNEQSVKDYLNTLCNNKIIDMDINNLSNLITVSEPLTAGERTALKQVCRDNGVAWVDFMRRKGG